MTSWNLLLHKKMTKKVKYDAIIIGGGLGGLQCAYVLAKEKKWRVCVLEQNALLGGCLQTFKRGGHLFDTGFHYVGGLAEGEPLNQLFSYFNLLHLPWKRMDSDCFDEIIVKGKSYAFANGHEQFVERLSKEFPHQRENLIRYSEKLQEIGRTIFDKLNDKGGDFFESPYFTQTAKDFLEETISDEQLRMVLAGASLKMQLDDQLPLYIFAQINNSFINSAWRIEGGGMQIATSLANDIRKMGGDVFTRQKVTALVETDGRVTQAIVNNGEKCYEADVFISNAHPMRTNEWLESSKGIRKIYRKRIAGIPNSFGIFTVNLLLKENAIRYQNRNQYIYETEDIWHLAEERNDGKSLLVSYLPPKEGQYTRNIDLLAPMRWSEVEQWVGTHIMQRGEAYEELKRAKAEACIRLAAKHIPGLEESIEKIFTSTPLTYYDYTGTQCGAAFGTQKDCSRLMQTVLPVTTPIHNLYQTGQNINLHGILGVSITALLTCKKIINKEAEKADRDPQTSDL